MATIVFFYSELFVKNPITRELYDTGDKMRRPKLAQTLKIIAEQGPDVFYTGELADKIVKEIRDRGGIIKKEDLAAYEVDFREALSVDISNNYTAYTTHAPSSGPILTFILNILQGIQILLFNKIYRRKKNISFLNKVMMYMSNL